MTHEVMRIDARGMRCPWPVLRVAKALRDHDVIEILADDPIAADELAALARENGWAFAVAGEARFHLAKSDG